MIVKMKQLSNSTNGALIKISPCVISVVVFLKRVLKSKCIPYSS